MVYPQIPKPWFSILYYRLDRIVYVGDVFVRRVVGMLVVSVAALRLREHSNARPPVPVAPVATRHACSLNARRNGPIDTATPKNDVRRTHRASYAPTRAKLRE